MVNHNQTGADIGFKICQIAFNLENATAKDIIIANKIIKRLSERQYHLTYQPIRENHKIAIFADAPFGNLPNEGSQ